VPQRLRPFFRRNRERLTRLARAAGETVKELLQDADGDRIVYRSDARRPRHGADFRAFDPLDFIAEVVAHIPDTH